MKCLRIGIGLATMVLAMLLVPAAAALAQGDVEVMTFNIRYGSAADGDNHWDLRKDFLAEVIADEAPDVVGLQEALHHQIEFLLGRLPNYAMVGVGRDDGKRAGEYSAILYRKDRLAVQQSDTFWFSDTPDVVASTSWGNDITRVCTWARLVARGSGAAPFYVFNVHLDHRSQPSRERSAALLRARIEAREPKAPFVVTGDFNAGPTNPAIAVLTAGQFVVDSYRSGHTGGAPDGTFSGFTIGKVDGEKIDYIFVAPGTQVVEADIVRTSRDGRYPSDHFPVTAHLRFGAAVQ